MSNETDLDWLARNVHKWPEGKREVLACWPRNVDALIWSSVLSDAGWITKDQWLARHAELASQFKPLTSIEDNQEQVMTQQKDMKQDNKWFERGELPPVGVECEAKKYGKEEWYKVVICGAGKHLGLTVAFYEKQKGSGAFTCSSAEYFRPIRTEREVAIEEMQSDIAERWANCEELAKYLVEKGWVKAGK